MLGTHRRTRSLIPVKTMDQYEKKIELVEIEVEVEPEYQAQAPAVKDKDGQIRLAYLTIAAVALMTSSAEPQVQRLLSSGDACGSLTSSYLRSILESTFAFGGAFGLFAGILVDHVGRKPVVIAGLLSMVALSGLMAFAQTLAMCACMRFVLGALSSSTGIASLCMLGDLCRNSAERIRLIAPLPFLLAYGSIFNGFQETLVQILEGMGWTGELNASLTAQVVGGLFAFFVAMSSYAKMEETSPA
ncbi:hypothetical protein EV356DRAFT_435905, partial [Viridothelium virens]